MFHCPNKQCARTFTKRAALCEHFKKHEGEAYWERLDNIININRMEYESEEIIISDKNGEIVINEGKEEEVVISEVEGNRTVISEEEDNEYITELVR